MKLRVEFDRETDGRWIAEVPELPGVLAYGKTRAAALAAVEALALRVIADRIENGELTALPDVLFQSEYGRS
ncbi:type II toxin-antitoxin system HicB family antitoxin [Candidatus Binatus soli]|jgi:predicted RNase H-like HicB family nuclease|uniref:type II toxin-antitoxin system HicB family antitoxin n=1 Tax=Candidatus Binatus soli TaxID=1953413 RepID=UPI003D0C44BE